MIQSITKDMIYVTIDEKAMVKQLFQIKEPSAVYYNTYTDKNKLIGYHWNLTRAEGNKLRFKAV